MYVHYLLGLGGWVGAAPDEDETSTPEAEKPAAALPQAAGEPRPGCFAGRPAHRCCWRRPSGLRA